MVGKIEPAATDLGARSRAEHRRNLHLLTQAECRGADPHVVRSRQVPLRRGFLSPDAGAKKGPKASIGASVDEAAHGTVLSKQVEEAVR
jgi:hypothetical protein